MYMAVLIAVDPFRRLVTVYVPSSVSRSAISIFRRCIDFSLYSITCRIRCGWWGVSGRTPDINCEKLAVRGALVGWLSNSGQSEFEETCRTYILNCYYRSIFSLIFFHVFAVINYIRLSTHRVVHTSWTVEYWTGTAWSRNRVLRILFPMW